MAIDKTADPMRRLAALIEIDGDAALGLADRLKLSNADRARLVSAATPSPYIGGHLDRASARVALYRLGRAGFEDQLLLARAGGHFKSGWEALMKLAGEWTPPEFPLRGRDAVELGAKPGPDLGALLDAIEAWWIDGGFAAGRGECLAELGRRLGETWY